MMVINTEVNKKAYNIPLALLRIAACYAVVSIHFGNRIPFCEFAVPVFMFLAFYFGKPLDDWMALGRRLKRLAIPFVFWSGVGFCCRCVVEHSFDVKMLGLQMLFGMPANSPLYFMNLLMAYTVIFFLIHKYALKCRFAFCFCAIAVSFLLQYTGLNGLMWKTLPLVGEITCGRFVELFPVAVFGIVVRELRQQQRHYTMLALGILALLLCMLLNGLFSRDVGCVYSYGGVILFLGSIGVSTLLAVVGEKTAFVNSRVVNAVLLLSSLTAGIYYSHKVIGEAIRRAVNLDGSLLTLAVFVACATFVYCISRNRLGKLIVG